MSVYQISAGTHTSHNQYSFPSHYYKHTHTHIQACCVFPVKETHINVHHARTAVCLFVFPEGRATSYKDVFSEATQKPTGQIPASRTLSEQKSLATSSPAKPDFLTVKVTSGPI